MRLVVYVEVALVVKQMRFFFFPHVCFLLEKYHSLFLTLALVVGVSMYSFHF